MMYRIVLISLAYVVVKAHPDDKMRPCARFTHPEHFNCCNKQYPKFVSNDDIDECMQTTMKAPSCEREICVATKLGYATSDGTIDKNKLSKSFETLLKDETKLFGAIKEKCIEGDLSKYGPPDFCDLMKMKFCVDMQVLADCPQWDEDGECEGIKNAAQECLKNFS